MSAKLAELLALATDVTWSASFSDRRLSVSVYAKSARLPGAGGLCFDLQTPTVWRVRPSTSSLRQEEVAFWCRFSVRADDPFAGFDLTTEDLAAVLPAAQFAIVLDGLRSIAARHERSAFEDAETARDLRAVIQKYDRSWACPVRVAADQFEDPGHGLRVERLQEQGEWRPAGCWVLRKVNGYPRSWLEPGWWATRRAADDEARCRQGGASPASARPVVPRALLGRLMDGTETWELSHREVAFLIDAVMVFMHQIERIPQNDLSEMPELQRLLDRLMSGERMTP